MAYQAGTDLSRTDMNSRLNAHLIYPNNSNIVRGATIIAIAYILNACGWVRNLEACERRHQMSCVELLRSCCSR